MSRVSLSPAVLVGFAAGAQGRAGRDSGHHWTLLLGQGRVVPMQPASSPPVSSPRSPHRPHTRIVPTQPVSSPRHLCRPRAHVVIPAHVSCSSLGTELKSPGGRAHALSMESQKHMARA